ncbi:MAG: tRNA 5-methoxyuridine(34)/uridine 5-oxyacetic acid(34) synthase CmoB [Pseudomonadota bacterium]
MFSILHWLRESDPKDLPNNWIWNQIEKSDYLKELLEKKLMNPNFDRWIHYIKKLPKNISGTWSVENQHIKIHVVENEQLLESCLKGLSPWRKGPFQIGNLHINTEWRSQFKWNRLINGLNRNQLFLKNKAILDVGSGNGYYAYRAIAEGAQRIVCIDPSDLAWMQWSALQGFISQQHQPNIEFLPVALEDYVELNQDNFDVVFSMGVLYHRRSPLDHLRHIFERTRVEGFSVIETLITDQGSQQSLLPESNYAKMRNVWMIPSLATLKEWMQKIGWKNIMCVSQSITQTYEQRATDWMTYESLQDFLNMEDPRFTCEGLNAPMRVIMVGKR